MSNNARVEPETKTTFGNLGGFRVLSLGQVRLCHWMAQASQAQSKWPSTSGIFSSEVCLSQSFLCLFRPQLGPGFSWPWLRLAGSPCCSQWVAPVGHSHMPWPLQVSGDMNCGLGVCNTPLSNTSFCFSSAEPITAFPGENSYFPGKTALLLVVLFCWHGLLHGRKAMCVLVKTANVLSTEMASVY